MMNKRLFTGYVICCFAVQLCAQQNNILLRINNEEITRSEVETAYHDYCLSVVKEKKGIRDFLFQFIDDRLKMIEAKAMGLDTTPEYRLKTQEYAETLRMGFFAGGDWDVVTQGELQPSYPAKRFLVTQIYKSIAQNCSNSELEKTRRLMNGLYEQLTTDPGVDFDVYVEAYSEKKERIEIGWLETPAEFEQTVFSMQKDEISAPFFTPQGMHIVKVLDVKDSFPAHKWKKEAQLRTRKRYKHGVDAVFLQQLKTACNYAMNPSGVNELLALGQTDKVLFTLNEKAYTGDDFHYFAQVNPKGIQRQFDDFVIKSLIDCENEQRKTNCPEHQQSIEAYQNALLVSEITRVEVTGKARTDKAGLSAYFSVHKKDYRWTHPRFKGVVLHARDKHLISEAKKRIKKQPADEWQKVIAAAFNSGGIQQVQVEQGLYKEGDNVYVDSRVFKKGRADSPVSYPFTAVVGKKMKGPENYKEAPESLISDYEKFLEMRWMKRLHQTYKVEINEEVLKTVNNH